MNPDTVANVAMGLLAALILLTVYLNHRWIKADRGAAQERKPDLPRRLIVRQPNHPGRWHPDGPEAITTKLSGDPPRL